MGASHQQLVVVLPRSLDQAPIRPKPARLLTTIIEGEVPAQTLLRGGRHARQDIVCRWHTSRPAALSSLSQGLVELHAGRLPCSSRA